MGPTKPNPAKAGGGKPTAYSSVKRNKAAGLPKTR